MNKFTAVEVPLLRLNIGPRAKISRAGSNRATITALINCPDKQRISIKITLNQDDVQGRANKTSTCKGRMESYPLHVSARKMDQFNETSGTVKAQAIIRDRGKVVDRQDWTRRVTIKISP